MPAPEMLRGRPGYAVVCGVLTLLFAFMAGLFAYSELNTIIDAESPVAIEVQPGETLSQVSRRLAADGLLRRPRLLTLLGILRGDSASIKAGEYVLQGRVTPGELLDSFVSGHARFVSFTVPEGLSLHEIALRLEAQALGQAPVFLALTRDPDFIATLPLPLNPSPPSLEGLLFPETYFFHRGVSEASLIRAMVEQFGRMAGPLLRGRAGQVGLSPYEALILASIVEKETGVASERPLIAAVFHNRLRAHMRLGSDPTVIYGIEDFDGNLKRAHLLTETPYNTYKITGLPPTPIANPGLASIRATVHPADADFLYFVARGDGTHEFSRDYRAHSRAVFKYQIRPHRRRNS